MPKGDSEVEDREREMGGRKWELGSGQIKVIDLYPRAKGVLSESLEGLRLEGGTGLKLECEIHDLTMVLSNTAHQVGSHEGG